MVASFILGLLLASGVIVESVGQGSAAEKAGLRAGDRIDSWSQGSASGPIHDPFELDSVEMERAPLGAVFLAGSGPRGAFEVPLSEEPWRIGARPELSDDALQLWNRARSAEAAGRHVEAAELHERTAAATADPRSAAWLRIRSGAEWVAAAQWQRAQAQYAVALDGRDATLKALGLLSMGKTYKDAGRRSETRQALEEASRLLEPDGQAQLTYARGLLDTGRFHVDYSHVDEGEPPLERGLRIVEALAPESLLRASFLHAQALSLCFRGEMAACEALLRQAYELRARKGPDTFLAARSLGTLGTVAADRGDLAVAERELRRAIAIIDKTDPAGARHAIFLNSLGTVLAERGDLDAADDVLRRVLDLGDAVSPLARCLALSNLGETAMERGRIDRSRELLAQALQVAEGDEALLEQVLPAAGRTALAAKDLPAAQGYFERSRSLLDARRVKNARLADALIGLGDVADARGDLALAESLYREALATEGGQRSGSFAQAETFARLGSVRLRAGDPAGAVEHFDHATLALESQRGRLGSGGEGGFARLAAFAQLHADHIDALLRLGRPADAFRVAERARARALLELLAQRDLEFSRDIPAELDHERKRINRRYDLVQAALAEAGPDRSKEELEGQAAELRELEQARLRLAAEIRGRSSPLAAFQVPQPLSWSEAEQALDPDTVLLSYVVGGGETFLFAMKPTSGSGASPTHPAVYRISIGRTDLQERVAGFVSLLHGPSVPALLAEAEALYDLLVRPAEAIIAAGARVLVSPDGPLQTLPFSALARPNPGAGPLFLAEWRPTHYTGSATLYAALRKRRPAGPPSPMKVAVFGDPAYPQGARPGVEIPLYDDVRGPALVPLPATRREAEEISRLFSGHVSLFLGSEATEANARALPRDTRYVHFACHALPNSRRPLDSALALTVVNPPSVAGGNGLLQAWEIFEAVRVDADLVTLSACESGLGKDVGGEGLVGLTRAFQYSGARSVLASVWNVADDSTAELMAVFYRKLKEGKPKDRALQDAQIAMIRRGRSPFHWAAFQLTGDWR